MSLNGTEWQDYAVFQRTLFALQNKDLTEEEKYVIIWLTKQIKILTEKKQNVNIFYLSAYPDQCAEMHNNSHCSKMIIEYAQLMSTAHRVLDGTEYYGRTKNNRKIKRWKLNSELEHILYKASHINHPSGIWMINMRCFV